MVIGRMSVVLSAVTSGMAERMNSVIVESDHGVPLRVAHRSVALAVVDVVTASGAGSEFEEHGQAPFGESSGHSRA